MKLREEKLRKEREQEKGGKEEGDLKYISNIVNII